MKIAFSNLGCKLNQAEIDDMARQFAGAGHEIVGSVEQAEIHVVNSCTVTHVAARDSRKIVRRGKRRNPDLKTVLTGCYVSAGPAEAEQLAGVDLVVPNTEKDNLLERFHQRFPECVPTGAEVVGRGTPYLPTEIGPSRPLVKIEDGCNMRCSFCIIPLTRGRQQSRSPTQVFSEIQRLESVGYQEVVITGVQISSYESDVVGLYELVERALRNTDTIRFRLTSIAPWQFDSRLLKLFESGRLCRHFHLSLQSGCAETLCRMHRPYSPEEFSRLVTQIRSAVPNVALTTDIIVGFPGETDDEFEQSLSFAQALGFARIHAFPFSQRPGTEAHDHPSQVAHSVKRERMDRILELARLSQMKFQHDCLNTEVAVLWEDQKSDYWIGTSDNYLRVRSRASGQPSGKISTVLLTHSDAQGMQGQLLPTTPSARPSAIGHTGTAREARTYEMEVSKSLAQS